LSLGEPIFFNKTPQGQSLLEEIQVTTLNIFHHRHKGTFAGIGLNYVAGHRLETCHFGSTEPALPRYQLIATFYTPDGQGSDDTVEGNALAEGLQGIFVENKPRLIGIGNYQIYGDLPKIGGQ